LDDDGVCVQSMYSKSKILDNFCGYHLPLVEICET